MRRHTHGAAMLVTPCLVGMSVVSLAGGVDKTQAQVTDLTCSRETPSQKTQEELWISEVRYQDPKTQTYVSSPSLLRLPDGALLATHDFFGPGAPLSHEGEEYLTAVYRSEDNGLTWQSLNCLSYTFWASLFEHRGSVYLLGTSAHDGHIIIRRSDDGGYTWTTPTSDVSGLLFLAGPKRLSPNYHCAPVPVVMSRGRIWRAFEDSDQAPQFPQMSFAEGFKALVISADEDADLLKAASWRMSEKLPFDQANTPPGWGTYPGQAMGWLEGNVVEGPGGQLWNILRVNSRPVLNKAAMVRILDEGRRLQFDPATGFIDLPGGMSKFTIRRDRQTAIYWTISNEMRNGKRIDELESGGAAVGIADDVPDETRPVYRNRLALFSSPDLRNWTKRKTLMEHFEPNPAEALLTTGFQYVDWQFDGEDIIYLVRTSYDGAHSFHDSNRITFGRVENFRALSR